MKRRFERMVALDAAQEIVDLIKGTCDRIQIAGSIRRHKPTVGDIEILYVPKFKACGQMTFDAKDTQSLQNLTDFVLEEAIHKGILRKRLNENGHEMWGEKNKLALHVESGIPVDLFSTTITNWWVSLVIRTGGKATNIELATAAQRHGFKLQPYKDGFLHRRTGKIIHCDSEEEVFRTVGLPCLPPEQRK